DIVELERGEIRLDAELAVMIAAADLADQLERDITRHRRTEIEPEPCAARIVKRCRKTDVGVTLGGLLVVERSWLAADLDVALHLIAGIAGDDLQRVGLQLLV